jgi:hypothetical protein
VRAVRGTVALSFGHEMNGYWYDWGYRDVSPASFIRAWRVIHAVFASAGARNVIWLWTVNKNGGAGLVRRRRQVAVAGRGRPGGDRGAPRGAARLPAAQGAAGMTGGPLSWCVPPLVR